MPVLSPVKMEKVSLTEVGSADVVCRGLGGWRYLKKASEGAFGTNGWAEYLPMACSFLGDYGYSTF